MTPYPVLRTQHLSHTYPGGRRGLEDVSFSVGEGECAALVGPNGAGKTTLFLRLCGVLPGRPGQASVGGLDPADGGQRKKLPETVGVVFQNPDDQLFSPTVLDDVAFGPLNLGASPEEAMARAAEALRAAGLPDAGGRVPGHLSGGEKRRAALAGVLAMRPAVLLLDEPTMFLDPRGRRELIGLLRDLPGTKLIATHDLDLVLDLCPRVLVLDGGRLAADGPAAELLADPDLMGRHGLEVPYRLRPGERPAGHHNLKASRLPPRPGRRMPDTLLTEPPLQPVRPPFPVGEILQPDGPAPRRGHKIIAVLPAYNAAATLAATLADIPRGSVDEILLVDDCSRDDTVRIARDMGLAVIVHEKNTGYGGNQKTCYRYCLDHGADVVVMIHPDYQYDARVIPHAVGIVELGICDVVLGNRVRSRAEALKCGMPWWKYVSNRGLTALENLALGQNLGEFHSGFRVYRRTVLETVPFERNSDDFVFDTQFLVQAVHFGFRLGDVPVPVRYFDQASQINFRRSARYGVQTLATVGSYWLNRLGLRRSDLFRPK